jgi:hypothetical protein
MENLNLTAKAEMAGALCELECSQLAEVNGGYQPVYVPPMVFATPFTYDEAPSRGVPVCIP